MARITLPTPEIGPNAGIPFTGLLYGLQFVDGVADAEIGEHLAQSMTWQGATIETTAAEYGTPDEPAPALSELTVPELRALADDRGVELDGATKKAAIIAALEDAAAPAQLSDIVDDEHEAEGPGILPDADPASYPADAVELDATPADQE